MPYAAIKISDFTNATDFPNQAVGSGRDTAFHGGWLVRDLAGWSINSARRLQTESYTPPSPGFAGYQSNNNGSSETTFWYRNSGADEFQNGKVIVKAAHHPSGSPSFTNLGANFHTFIDGDGKLNSYSVGVTIYTSPNRIIFTKTVADVSDYGGSIGVASQVMSSDVVDQALLEVIFSVDMTDVDHPDGVTNITCNMYNAAATFDETTGVVTGTLLATNVFSDFTPELQIAGAAGLACGNGASDFQNFFAKAGIFALSAGLNINDLGTTARGRTHLTLTVPGPTGGSGTGYEVSIDRAPDVAGSPGSFVNIAPFFSTTGITTYLDSGPLTPDTTYWYRIHAKDDAAHTADSVHNTAIVTRTATELVVGLVGDSIWSGTVPPLTWSYIAYWVYPDPITLLNSGIAGASTADWGPADGHGYYTTLKNLMVGNDANVATMMLGTNDANAATTATTYDTNMRAIVNGLLSDVPTLDKVFLCFSSAVDPARQDPADNVLLVQYQAKILAFVDNVHIFLGDDKNYQWFIDHPEELADGTHPNGDGALSMGTLQALRQGMILSNYGPPAASDVKSGVAFDDDMQTGTYAGGGGGSGGGGTTGMGIGV